MAQQIDNVTCLGCGCLCDDLVVHISEGQIVKAERACSLGEKQFVGRHADEGCEAEIDGEKVSLEAAIERAAEILAGSSAPLIYGLSLSPVETHRVAIELADRMGGVIDPAISPFHRAALVALQAVGISTCTLGEVKDRADVMVFWGCDPATTHPRFFERFVDPPGQFLSESRQVVLFSDQQNATVELVDDFFQLDPDSAFEILITLRAIVQGVAVEGKSIGGISLDRLKQLAAELSVASYSAHFFGPGLVNGASTAATLESLFLLVRQLNSRSRCAAIGLGGPTTENVLTWQTGYPCGVNFSAGFPQYDANSYSADQLLARREVDALLIIGSESIEYLSSAASDRLGELPVVLLEARQDVSKLGSSIAGSVRIPVAQPDLHSEGTVFRMDGVPLPLRPVIGSPLQSESEILAAIMERVFEKCG